MFNARVIARLDVKGPNLVKGIHLEGLRVLGKPKAFAEHYYHQGADEIMYMDVVASLYDRNSLGDLVADTARNIFIPITVGGGIRTLDNIRTILRAGADKVAINTAAIKNPQLIRDAALAFGSSTIVVTIEAIKESNGTYLAYTDNGREHTGKDVVEWAKQVEALGAGEIVLTSVDREGTAEGFDLELLKKITTTAKIPVIAHGGAGSSADVCSAIQSGGADAVALATILHYDTMTKLSRPEDQQSEGNFEFVSSGRVLKHVKPTTITEVKSALRANHIPCRPSY
jgi:cyclase